MSANAKQPAASQPLPPKELNLFRQVVKFYENKQHKKALKAADQVLKKFPDHGETLAMKGLVVNSMAGDGPSGAAGPGGAGNEKKEEAYDLVRRGLKADLKSHVCWHVYGLLYRSDREYREAIKCYLNALRIDKDNAQILRDLANLQVQMRDLPGYVETRHKLLTLKSSQRNNWISFAVAHHINGSHDMAVQILDSYEGTLEEVSSAEAYEHSEMLLYKAQVLAEGGRAQDALACLDANKDKIRDRWSLAELRAGLLLRLGRAGEARAAYLAQLDLNPDHYKMHEGLRAASGLWPAPPTSITPPPIAGAQGAHSDGGADGAAAAGASAAGAVAAGGGDADMANARLDDTQRAELAALYRKLQAQYPRSTACRRMPLDFLRPSESQDNDFSVALDAYVRPFLRRGVPSLFVDLRPLYSDAAKRDAVQALFERYAATLREGGAGARLPPLLGSDPVAVAAEAKQQQEDAFTQVWVLYFLARHYDHIGNYTKALGLLDEATAASPSSPGPPVELLSGKAKVLRHAGDAEAAAHVAEAARRVDLSDRYLNSCAVKALLAAGRPDAADKTAALFVRDSGPGEPTTTAGPTLYDMQHMWYELAAGASHWSRGELGPALKKYIAITKHFDDIHEDQFDFHGYCVRKMTLRAYLAMLRMEDALYGERYYAAAVGGAVRVYLALYDRPPQPTDEERDEAAMAGMSADERKKYKLRRKKEEKQRAKEAEEKAKAAEEAARVRQQERAAAAAAAAGGAKDGAAKKTGGGPAKDKDPDPEGAALLAACDDPLGQAGKLVAMLKQHRAGAVATQLLAFEVYRRKGRLLLALSAVQRAMAAADGGAGHPDVHVALVRLAALVQRGGAAGSGGAAGKTATAPAGAAGAAAPATTAAAAAPTPAAQAEVVQRVVQEGLAALLQGQSVEAYVSSWAAKYAAADSSKGAAEEQTGSLEQRVAAATAALLLQEGRPDGEVQAAKQTALALVLGSDLRTSCMRSASSSRSSAAGGPGRRVVRTGPDHAACVRVHKALSEAGGVLQDEAAAAKFKAQAAAVFPHSAYFEGAARVPYQAFELDNMVEAFGRLSF